jgi:L-amino acid N-acyltransferase YncA
MSLEIVEMEKSRLEAALGVYQWYVRNSTATFQIADADAAGMERLLFFAEDRYRSFAALDGGAFVGYGIVTRYKSREAFDHTAEVTIYLAREATGKGYGRAMLSRLEDFARSKGLHLLVAQISGENDASARLFERAGYAACARYREAGRKFGRWIDLVCYEKILG